jgi:hypothetical protein
MQNKYTKTFSGILKILTQKTQRYQNQLKALRIPEDIRTLLEEFDISLNSKMEEPNKHNSSNFEKILAGNGRFHQDSPFTELI